MAKTIYISGPITGVPDYQQKFKDAKLEVASLGYVPITPIEVCSAAGLDEGNHEWLAYMKANIRAVLEVDGLYMLRDWWQSKGARVEHGLAIGLDLLILYQPDKENTR